jgi:hypothetical protein
MRAQQQTYPKGFLFSRENIRPELSDPLPACPSMAQLGLVVTDRVSDPDTTYKHGDVR